MAFGWQRDEVRNSHEDENDYLMVRKFSRDGQPAGAFLPRSMFARGLSPFSAGIGLWRVRASDERIGAIANASSHGNEMEWLELNLKGELTGRWPIGKRQNGGHAYTADGRLFGKAWDPKTKQPQLAEFDRGRQQWTPLADVPDGLLLGADGNNLVFAIGGAIGGGARLERVKPPSR